MEIDFLGLPPRDRYKLLVGFVIPRPIAFVSTRGTDGVDNAAPFSFFNVFGEDPATVVLGIQARPDGTLKDTARNIRETGEFVINMVDEAIAEKMNICATDFPPGQSELGYAGLTLEPSHMVKPGRLAEAPAALECRHVQTIEFKPTRALIIGEVVWIRARDDVIDSENLRIRDKGYKPVGRLYADLYSRQSERFELLRKSVVEFEAEKAE